MFHLLSFMWLVLVTVAIAVDHPAKITMALAPIFVALFHIADQLRLMREEAKQRHLQRLANFRPVVNNLYVDGNGDPA